MNKYLIFLIVGILVFLFTTKTAISNKFMTKKYIQNPTFDDFIKVILKNEGGLVTDSGGLTNFGISDKADGKIDLKYKGIDIKKMNILQAKEIYKKDYFDLLAIHFIKYPLLCLHIFDSSVNAGIGQTKKFIFQTFGGQTISEVLNKIKNSNDNDLSILFINCRIRFYKDLASSKPLTHQKYLKGWLNRINNTYFI